jgi:hypothetical protein
MLSEDFTTIVGATIVVKSFISYLNIFLQDWIGNTDLLRKSTNKQWKT